MRKILLLVLTGLFLPWPFLLFADGYNPTRPWLANIREMRIWVAPQEHRAEFLAEKRVSAEDFGFVADGEVNSALTKTERGVEVKFPRWMPEADRKKAIQSALKDLNPTDETILYRFNGWTLTDPGKTIPFAGIVTLAITLVFVGAVLWVLQKTENRPRTPR